VAGCAFLLWATGGCLHWAPCGRHIGSLVGQCGMAMLLVGNVSCYTAKQLQANSLIFGRVIKNSIQAEAGHFGAECIS